MEDTLVNVLMVLGIAVRFILEMFIELGQWLWEHAWLSLVA